MAEERRDQKIAHDIGYWLASRGRLTAYASRAPGRPSNLCVERFRAALRRRAAALMASMLPVVAVIMADPAELAGHSMFGP